MSVFSPMANWLMRDMGPCLRRGDGFWSRNKQPIEC